MVIYNKVYLNLTSFPTSCLVIMFIIYVCLPWCNKAFLRVSLLSVHCTVAVMLFCLACFVFNCVLSVTWIGQMVQAYCWLPLSLWSVLQWFSDHILVWILSCCAVIFCLRLLYSLVVSHPLVCVKEREVSWNVLVDVAWVSPEEGEGLTLDLVSML